MVDFGGNFMLPAIVTFHGGLIKHDGELIIRRALHTLFRLVMLKARLLALASSSAPTPRVALEEAKRYAQETGLDTHIAQVQAHLAKRMSAVSRPRHVPSLQREITDCDEDLRTRLEKRKDHADRYLNRAVCTEVDREAQIQRLLTEAGGTLAQLVWPTDVHTVPAMLTFIRELENGKDINKAAAATGNKFSEKAKRQYRPRDTGLTGKPDREECSDKVRDQGYTSMQTEMQARWILASGETKQSIVTGIQAMTCTRCNRRSLVKLHPTSFHHACQDGRVTSDHRSPLFSIRVLKHSWEVGDWLRSSAMSASPTSTATTTFEYGYSLPPGQVQERNGRWLSCWRAQGLPDGIADQLTSQGEATQLAQQVASLPQHLAFDFETHSQQRASTVEKTFGRTP